MRYRDAYLVDDEVLANSGTTIIDLNVIDPITELWLEVYANNNATGPNQNSPIARCVSKIEIVDGSDVLYSLNGQQAIAACCFDLGRQPHRALQDRGGFRQIDTFPLRFGRWFGDGQYALDTAKFTNPQLKITWDLATLNAIGANGYADGTGRLRVLARIMETPRPSPVGFMMTKEHYSFTTGSSGDERIDLPTDHTYRKLMIRCWETHVGLDQGLTEFKLSIDNDKYIPFDLHAHEMQRKMEQDFGRFSLVQKGYGDNNQFRELWIDADLRAQISAQEPKLVAGFNLINAGYCQVTLYNGAEAAQTGQEFQLVGSGLCPENTWCHLFGKQDEPNQWLSVGDINSIRLFLEQGNENAAASVFLQQVRMY